MPSRVSTAAARILCATLLLFLLAPASTPASAVATDVLGPVSLVNPNVAGPALFVRNFTADYGLAEIEILTEAEPFRDFQILMSNGQSPFLRPAGNGRLVGVLRLGPFNQLRVQLNPQVGLTLRVRQAVQPMGHWTFDDQQGIVVEDISGRGRNGQLESAEGWITDGERTAFRFHRPGGVRIPDDGGQNSAEMTVEAFIRPEGPQEPTAFVVSKYHGGVNAGFFLGVRADNRPACTVSSPTGLRTIQGSVPLSQAWHHVACVVTVDGMSLHVDSAVVDSAPREGGVMPSSSDLWIGQNGFFNGSVDEVRLHGAALEPAQFLVRPGPTLTGQPDLPSLDAGTVQGEAAPLRGRSTLSPLEGAAGRSRSKNGSRILR